MNGYERLEKYSKLIGWSNPKNWDKIIKWKKQYPELGKEVYGGSSSVVEYGTKDKSFPIVDTTNRNPVTGVQSPAIALY